MPVPSFLAGIFGKSTGNILESIAKSADRFITTPDEKKQFSEEVQKEINRHMEVMQEHSDKAIQLYLEDVANARAMQIVALNQSDKFSKRFIYYFAGIMSLITLSYDFCFFFVKFPPENKDLLTMVAGVLNTTCLVMIISFFFGSSKSSEDKQKQIEKMMNK